METMIKSKESVIPICRRRHEAGGGAVFVPKDREAKDPKPAKKLSIIGGGPGT
jgi:hypothetical protein